jgi:hypothetical protein
MKLIDDVTVCTTSVCAVIVPVDVTSPVIDNNDPLNVKLASPLNGVLPLPVAVTI